MLRAVPSVEQAIAYMDGSATGPDAERHPLPNLILIDISLQGTSGFRLLEWLRSTPAHKHLPAVMLTSSVAYHDIKQALDSGANSYIIKPPSLTEIQKMVATLVAYWNLSSTP